MIEYHFLKFLEDNGFGTIDSDLFTDGLPVQVDPSDPQHGNEVCGLAIIPNGGEKDDNGIYWQARFELRARGGKRETKQKLHDIIDLLCCEDCIEFPPYHYSCCKGEDCMNPLQYMLCGIDASLPQSLGTTLQGNWLYRVDIEFKYCKVCNKLC